MSNARKTYHLPFSLGGMGTEKEATLPQKKRHVRQLNLSCYKKIRPAELDRRLGGGFWVFGFFLYFYFFTVFLGVWSGPTMFLTLLPWDGVHFRQIFDFFGPVESPISQLFSRKSLPYPLPLQTAL